MMRNFDNCNFYFANSCKQATILLPFIALLFSSGFPSVVSDLRLFQCNNGSTDNANENTFSSNLNRVTDDLVKNAPQTGFNTSSHGQGPSAVYGLLQCVGNISQNDCSICSQQAKDSVPRVCGNATGGRLWLDNCFLRYDNFSFFSKLDSNGSVWMNMTDVDPLLNKLSDYKNATSRLISNLSDEVYRHAEKGFAEGSAAYSSNSTVYGLVQCLRDISSNDCRSCLKSATSQLFDCCSMKQAAAALLGSCRVRIDSFPFFETSEGGNTSASPPTSSVTNPPKGAAHTRLNGTSGSSTKKFIILAIVGGGVLVLVLCLFAMRRKLKSSFLVRQNEEIHENGSKSTLLLLEKKQLLFTLDALVESTDNFHESNKLGEGGFGSVYKGKTKDGKQIAVKKLSVISSQGNEEFTNEVKVLAKVPHRNLVKLLGCCAEGPERLIVYEFVPNKNLHTLLFDTDPDQKRKLLDWQTRYKIIMGVARGLCYLHEESDPRIIHRDIKAENILLDKTLNPKIADFGLARLFPEDKSHIQTTVAGTYGYMAPEYAMQGQLSTKADVYSFGVLVLEIVSGRKNSDIDFPQEMQSLLEWAWRLYKQGRLSNLIDSTISETCQQGQAVRCIHVALLCTHVDASIRPTISNVIRMISGSSGVLLPNPQKPAFVKTTEE